MPGADIQSDTVGSYTQIKTTYEKPDGCVIDCSRSHLPQHIPPHISTLSDSVNEAFVPLSPLYPVFREVMWKRGQHPASHRFFR